MMFELSSREIKTITMSLDMSIGSLAKASHIDPIKASIWIERLKKIRNKFNQSRLKT